MDPCDNQQPDTVIISLLAKNGKEAWIHLYDKYVAMMYGIIFNMTGNETISSDILTDVFYELKAKKMLQGVKVALCHTLVRHTYKLATAYLKKRGLTPISIQSINGDYPVINSLYFELATINEFGHATGRSKEDVLISLREEFNHFQNQKQ